MLIPKYTWQGHRLHSDFFSDFYNDWNQMGERSQNSLLERDKTFSPSCDFRETAEHYLLSMDLPGINEDDIKIEKKGNYLSISGERFIDDSEVICNIKYEKSYGKFRRIFMISSDVSSDKIHANFDNGVLNVAIPKSKSNLKQVIPVRKGKSDIFNRQIVGNYRSKKVKT